MRALLATALLIGMIAAPADAAPRTWTSGAYKVDAELVEVRDGKAYLMRADGQKFAVDIDKLSAADQEFIRQSMGGAAPPVAAANGPVAEFLAQARQAMLDRDLDAARKPLAAALAAAKGTPQEADVLKLGETWKNIYSFWSAVDRAAAVIQGAEELEVKTSRIAVVECSPERLVVKAGGRTCRFTLADRKSIPAALAAAMAKRGLGSDPAAAGIVASFNELDPGANDNALWTAAAGGPAPARTFADLLNEPSTGPTTNDPAPGAPPSTAAAGNPPAVPATADRLPIPALADQTKAKSEMQSVFSQEFASLKDRAARHDLAKKLYQIANETYPKDPASCFVLVTSATDLACEAGDPEGAIQLVDWLTARYKIDDGMARRVSALTRAGKSPATPEAVKFTYDTCMELAEEAVASGEIDHAVTLAEAAVPAARILKDTESITYASERIKYFKELRNAQALLNVSLETLKTNPDDAAANYKAGSHYAFMRGDWSTALPYFAKAGDAALAEAAKADTASPAKAEDRLALADMWWSLHETKKHDDRGQIAARAGHWYQQALDAQLTSLARVKAEKRLEDIAKLATPGGTTAGPTGQKTETKALADLTLLGTSGLYSRTGAGLIRQASVGTRKFTKAIWTQPDTSSGAAKVAYSLDGQFTTLTGTACMDPLDGSNGLSSTSSYAANNPVLFRIIDEKGRVLWVSPRPLLRGETFDFKINVKGVKAITLVTTSFDYYYYARCFWGDVTVTGPAK
jgi:hypothetical protein